ncbi:MAG: RNA 2',3'-cyclic phosphodiesterase [Burkholderiales bacterium]
MPDPEQATQRLFFALCPNAGLQAGLHALGQSMRESMGGRVMVARNIHLTLAFLGSVPLARIDELRGIGNAIEAGPFELHLTETGCWKRSAVGWIAPATIPQALASLVEQLRQRLSDAGFRVDDKPFAAHVTLLRKVKCRPEPVAEAASFEWRVASFALMRSQTLQTGPVYSRVADWPLR